MVQGIQEIVKINTVHFGASKTKIKKQLLK